MVFRLADWRLRTCDLRATGLLGAGRIGVLPCYVGDICLDSQPAIEVILFCWHDMLSLQGCPGFLQWRERLAAANRQGAGDWRCEFWLQRA